MNMIRHTTYAQYLTSCCIDELADISEYAFQMIFGYLRTCGLHMEDNVQIYLAK